MIEFLGKWSVKNRVTVNLIMVFVVIAGVWTVQGMHREIYPQFALDMINIEVVYPGATPEEVEEGICIKIEEQIKGIEGITRILSSAHEGAGSVTVELDPDADSQKVLDDVRTEVDRIETFPEQAEDPVIVEVVHRNPVISVAVYGDVSERLLRETAERIRDDLLDSNEISLADLVGVRNYEISVEVSEDSLRKYGISFDEVVAAIKTGSIDLPGGTIKTTRQEILVRSSGQRYTGNEFEQLPVITTAEGTVVRLGQLAQVVDGFEDLDIKTRFNGKPTALVRVNRTSNEDIVAIADATRRYVEKQRRHLPEGIQIATWLDLSVMLKDRISLLLRNGWQGMALVFLTLAVFLNLRLAFWVTAGIPVAFMGAFLVLDFKGETVNMVSLFAFIMTLGIVVDDAIIVGENIFTHYGSGKSAPRAVVDGLKEVGGPVIMAIGTTVLAFVPLMFVSGIMGKFIAVMPKAVIAILLASLGEALIILPAHLNGALTHGDQKAGSAAPVHRRFRKRVENGLQWFIDRCYAPVLVRVIKNRYLTAAVGLGVLIICLGLIEGGYVPFVFFPKGESDWVIAEIAFPLGTPFTVTERAIARMEKQAEAVDAVFQKRMKTPRPFILNTFSLVGAIPRRDWKPGEYGAHVGEVWIELLSSEQRPGLSVNDAIGEWRNRIGEMPGVDRLSFYTIEGGPAGIPIEIQISGDDFSTLRSAADELKNRLATYPGTFDISDDFNPGKPESRIHIRPGARSAGVTMAGLAKQIRQAFYGEEADRVQRGRDDVKVMVRYGDYERRNMAGLERMYIRTPQGTAIPLNAVAEVTHGRAYSTIHRADRKRVITVVSDIDEDVGNAGKIIGDLRSDFFPQLVEKYPTLRYDLEGQEKRSAESLDSLKRGFAMALMGIFLLLANQFRSYFQPVIIMTAIPFGLIGAVAGHLIMGMDITIISIFGIVALSGIVVNDSLILIDFINRNIRGEQDVFDAVTESGKARFRPVILTSITTVAGLFPLLLEKSFQAQFLIPMAVSISFGLISATLLTLLYVPALYLIVRDITLVLTNK